MRASAPPPRIIKPPQRLSGREGCDERASDVAITGPTTPAVLMIAVSIAYAVRRKSSGTTIFQSGRTDKFIGGALSPMANAKININGFECIALRANAIAAYPGTMMRSGHVCPYLSIMDPRIPAVKEPAAALRPMAIPANAIEPVDCSALKKIDSPTIPYATRAGKQAISRTQTLGIRNSSTYRFIAEPVYWKRLISMRGFACNSPSPVLLGFRKFIFGKIS